MSIISRSLKHQHVMHVCKGVIWNEMSLLTEVSLSSGFNEFAYLWHQCFILDSSSPLFLFFASFSHFLRSKETLAPFKKCKTLINSGIPLGHCKVLPIIPIMSNIIIPGCLIVSLTLAMFRDIVFGSSFCLCFLLPISVLNIAWLTSLSSWKILSVNLMQMDLLITTQLLLTLSPLPPNQQLCFNA